MSNSELNFGDFALGSLWWVGVRRLEDRCKGVLKCVLDWGFLGWILRKNRWEIVEKIGGIEIRRKCLGKKADFG